MSLKDRIKEVDDIRKKKVFVDVWGVDVELRTMTGMERAQMLNRAMGGGEIQHEILFPELLIKCCYDPETGEKVFTEEDKVWLQQKSAAAFEQLVSEAMEVNGLRKEAVKEAEKNSSEIPSEDSISG